MTTIGTALTPVATKVMMLGAGELGKEVVIELQRLGVEVIAVDRYQNAPAQQVAHRAYTISMLDGAALKALVEKEQPDYIVPEVEAIATDMLLALEQQGFNVIPTAQATRLTMNREGIRRLAAEELGIPTSNYRFVDNFAALQSAVAEIGLPCVIKPIMSSSGHGQSVIKSEQQLEAAWQYAQQGGRAGGGRVIVEGFVKFDYEITLLTVRHIGGTTFLPPIGHTQIDGDYRESWQPQAMSATALEKAQHIAGKITAGLGGRGIFGVELFVCGDNVIFNEVSPRPHDTGMVTLISQELSEFALHARAILGLPIPPINLISPSASKAIVVEGQSKQVRFGNLEQVLAQPNTNLRLFGKGEVNGHRRLGVILARDESVETALAKVRTAYNKLVVQL
ncbi:formate-dependent phosphoribosylglycinamide formyltransferase [Testudinibacter sp. TR-2022]|uniref:formate-dependent phosphoribosylglycinamide formyltransferase n=1 Tax=Testudinibacter sp. TR-2022 TaxID=2585029 RepID=UPI001119516E|nr:formate-dependent phosphoribosylglycinamide formyltransferase [Testudinibacter sp. TR-2022]TNH04581.1 formate-dependent phosphoribosylglycinamide formyltransferase [Pasteurellaceae bacterium Phil31]TNH09405.1 formate-dependent phosphoribosylglycinamide formyltransferase [Testudinibacter sp. TR-2022]TNH09808.1 formate-dependent phosphoribosylglycinamide formyltransferase [Testudinibacter sp. TR-2022]TNH13853.1 formate-dependent phosphoribosylglycinamide formyltransferase [Testudinibacter sp. 